jgi:mRNA interferase RelE/StbE
VRYQINYTDEARRSLRILPGNYRQRIRRLIESLADDPRPRQAVELRDMPNRYRIRVDSWRLIYRVYDEEIVVLVLDIRHKSGPETYEAIDP